MKATRDERFPEAVWDKVDEFLQDNSGRELIYMMPKLGWAVQLSKNGDVSVRFMDKWPAKHLQDLTSIQTVVQ